MIGNVSIVSGEFLAGLAAAALAAWVGWRLLRRRNYRAVAHVVLAGAALLSSAGVASMVNRHFSYLPRLRDVATVVGGERNWADYRAVARMPVSEAARRYPRGVVTRVAVADRGSGFGRTWALAYLPPQYFTEPRRRFPVAYLLHGSPGVPADWFRGGDAASVGERLAAHGYPLILVAPRMSAGWLDDPECVDGVKERVETHFVRDVLPAVDSTLRTAANRDARAVVGMSAGGYCALNLGLRHRGLLSTIVDMSGYTRPTHSGGLAAVFGSGPAAAERAWANSPADYARTLSAEPPTRVWMDCGTGDRQILGQMRGLAPTLRHRGVSVRLATRPGGHTFTVWRPALAEALAWAAPGMSGAAVEAEGETGADARATRPEKGPDGGSGHR